MVKLTMNPKFGERNMQEFIEIKVGEEAFFIKPNMKMISILEDKYQGVWAIAKSIESNEFKVSDLLEIIYLCISISDHKISKSDLSDEFINKGASYYAVKLVEILNLIVAGLNNFKTDNIDKKKA